MSFVIGQQVVFTSENSFRKLGRITGINGTIYTISPNGSNSASSSVTASATNKSILPYFDISTPVTVTLTNKHSRGAQKWKGVIKGVKDENTNLKYNIELIDVAGTPTFTAYPNQVSKREISETVGFSTIAPFASVETSKNSAKVHTPSATASVPIGILPVEWSAAKNDTGKTYYYKLNGEITYDWPGTTSKTTVATASSAPVNSSTVATASSSTVAIANSASALPLNWRSAVDPGTGKTYYYNTTTGETTWDLPTVPDLVSESATGNYADPTIATVANSNLHREKVKNINNILRRPPLIKKQFINLPSNWIESVDPSTGKTYYYNTSTQTSQWNRPIVGGSRKKRHIRTRRKHRTHSSQRKSRR